jgi:hypothetical protein
MRSNRQKSGRHVPCRRQRPPPGSTGERLNRVSPTSRDREYRTPPPPGGREGREEEGTQERAGTAYTRVEKGQNMRKAKAKRHSM